MNDNDGKVLAERVDPLHPLLVPIMFYAVDIMSPDGMVVLIGSGLGITVGPLERSIGLDVAAPSQSQQQLQRYQQQQQQHIS